MSGNDLSSISPSLRYLLGELSDAPGSCPGCDRPTRCCEHVLVVDADNERLRAQVRTLEERIRNQRWEIDKQNKQACKRKAQSEQLRARVAELEAALKMRDEVWRQEPLGDESC